MEHKLGLLRCKTQVEAFLRGLHEPLPRESMMRLSKFVSVAEVSLCAGGASVCVQARRLPCRAHV